MWRVKYQRMQFLSCILAMLMLVTVFMCINLYTQTKDFTISSIVNFIPLQKVVVDKDAISQSLIPTCLVLTLDKTLLPFKISNKVTCFPFLGDVFNLTQFHRVSDDIKHKLRYPHLQVTTAELTNNQSLSIFINHERMWEHISRMPGDSPVLVLEDDIVVPENNSDGIMDAVVEFTRNRTMSNYIVKLHNRDMMHNYLKYLGLNFNHWERFRVIREYYMDKCLCSTPYDTVSTSAYIIDRKAALTLLFHAQKPIQYHVDIFMHELGCARHEIDLYVLSPDLFSVSGRTSTHIKKSFSWLKMWFDGMIQRVANHDCILVQKVV